MTRYIIVFLALWGLLTLGLSTWRHWTRSGLISMAKLSLLGLLGATAATAILAAIVTLF